MNPMEAHSSCSTVCDNMTLLPYRLGYLTKDMVVKAEKELGETKDVRERTVEEMRRLIIERRDLYFSLEENDMLKYLRARKFNVQRAFQLLLDECKDVKNFPEVFAPDFPNFVRTFSEGIINILPYRDKDGCIIFHAKYGCWKNIEVTTFAMAMHAAIILILLSADDPATQVCGIRVISDFEGSSLSHLKYFSLRLLRLAAVRPWKMHLRLKNVHIVNGNFFFRHIWNIIKYFFPEKMRKRFHIHSHVEDLQKHFESDVLPSEYGGQVDKGLFSSEMFDKSFEDRYNEVLSYGFRK